MKPTDFPQMTGTAAGHQQEYQNLPMYRDDEYVISCWDMTFRERLKVLFTGRVWLWLLCWHNPVTPSIVSVDEPEWEPQRPSDDWIKKPHDNGMPNITEDEYNDFVPQYVKDALRDTEDNGGTT